MMDWSDSAEKRSAVGTRQPNEACSTESLLRRTQTNDVAECIWSLARSTAYYANLRDCALLPGVSSCHRHCGRMCNSAMSCKGPRSRSTYLVEPCRNPQRGSDITRSGSDENAARGAGSRRHIQDAGRTRPALDNDAAINSKKIVEKMRMPIHRDAVEEMIGT